MIRRRRHPEGSVDLNQVTLPTVDLPRAVAFYQKLGLRQIVATDHYVRFELPEGGATLSLHVVERVLPSQTLIYFECDALDDTVRRLEAGGIVFDDGPEDKRWLWREARLSDPDGNPLCLYHAGENRRNPPWRLDDA